MSDIEEYGSKIFEQYKKVNEFGQDYWYARDLQMILDYEQWRNFVKVIKKAIDACRNSNQLVLDHFAEVSKMVEIGSGSKRKIEDWELSRYACYLVVQNADPKKEVVALGQTYFAVQTRKQELQEQFETMDEDKKRLAIRNELKEHNKSLAEAAQNAGVESLWNMQSFKIMVIKDYTVGLIEKLYIPEKV